MPNVYMTIRKRHITAEKTVEANAHPATPRVHDIQQQHTTAEKTEDELLKEHPSEDHAFPPEVHPSMALLREVSALYEVSQDVARKQIMQGPAHEDTSQKRRPTAFAWQIAGDLLLHIKSIQQQMRGDQQLTVSAQDMRGRRGQRH